MSDQPFNNDFRADAQQQLGGCLVALITPMTVDGAVDEKALRKLVHWHIDMGTHGLVPAGTTGESTVLNIAEQHRVCLLYTSPSPRDQRGSRMPSSA